MNQRRALVISLTVHAIVFLVLQSGIDLSHWQLKKAPQAIEARLIFSKPKIKDLLPRKIKTAAPPTPEKKLEKKPEPQATQPTEKVANKEVAKTPAPTASKFTKALASLSKTFAQDLADEKVVDEPEGEVIADVTYFDQIYSLIKSSFILPPHINGPQGRDLQTVVKLFLAADGSLLRIDLVTPSGDEHFDKAVIDGTRRVNNFGLVPVTLQNMVRERGIVVELCPFTCRER